MRNWSFKFQPVVWLTAVALVLGALLKADEEFHVLPAGPAHWIRYVVAVVGIILVGWQAYKAATPVADPKSAQGYPLVPAPPVGGGTPPAGDRKSFDR